MIIESNEELSYFLEQAINSDIFLFPVFTNQKKHSLNNELSLLYVYTFESDEEFILVFNHGEKFHDVYNLEIIKYLDTDYKIFTFDKKDLLHLYKFKNINDVNLLYYFATKETFDSTNLETNSHTFFNRMYRDREDLNNIIPIIKHLEYCSRLKNEAVDIIEKYSDILTSDVYKKYNKIIIENFYTIEQSGLYIDTSIFNNFFNDKVDYHRNKNKYLYTKYNIFTSTGRPSNSFGGINFAALKKVNGERSMIKSRFGCDGVLLEMDYDAFHIRLISDLVNYSFPDNISIHDYLGKQYFGKETLTKEEYEDSKNLTFQLLYGGISAEFKEISFFKVVDKYIYNIWNKVISDGYFESKIFKRKILKKDKNFTRQKLFNYVIQCHETEFNAMIIKKIIELLNSNSFKSKIILYTYDSILFDVHLTEAKQLVEKVKNIMNNDNKFPVKIKYGKDYHNMKDLRK